MKRIVFVIPTLTGGGAERVVINFATFLVEEGHHVDVFLLKKTSFDYSLENRNFNIHFVEERKLNFIERIKFLFVLRSKKIKAKLLLNAKYKLKELTPQADLVVSHLPSSDKICTQLKLPHLYCCLHRGLGKELDFFQKRKPFRSFRYKRNKLRKQRIYNNQNIITVSDGVKEDTLNLDIKLKSIQTIHNPFDFSDIRKQACAHFVKEQDYIIAVGRLSAEKRFDILLRAYAQANINEKLIILGQGKEEENIRRLISDLDLQNRVILKGFNPNPYPYIKNAKMLVLSSDMEGLPTVLIEALILGVPIVSTDCPYGPSEILIDELSPFLSPVGDVNALAKNMKEMINNPVNIEEKFIRRFHRHQILKQFLNLCSTS